MATLKGTSLSFSGLTFAQIGEKIVEASGSDDGKDILLTLTEGEEQGFCAVVGLRVGWAIATLVSDAIEKKTGHKPEAFPYRYSNLVFET
ncbi:MAG: hypothetical protein UT86_C0002G0115 [Candidatus Magasanikbacteria bacterium GW2011_GWC2_40_17]|uniref:Uncharacterized protein n=1 Tax=Candidatus Magasanikbacteria bacterium GW2011_GWA2_42_32 TaxID=1619039 RepID=A0A0G1CFC3_9BACT|nr:MAG: hypothetical protein UT86_C0002G0115 [Candidatus Magasanikbacteria bacterium GW2011_GWC2_40_17]KKS57276.1 MAG: hypothetical protein UV20_C0002G0065 [Candidatus Magasanikbacteria bacterium GW2011_GWA2_42_32]OGH86164.1 MAG: hypothetical protein A2294_02835 [Candidatus Magasanikbacteria bacterium RIFOXYB2_FULL_38_10]